MPDYHLNEPPAYLSIASANALISDIQPTTILPATLLHINLFLDEILYSLLSASMSLNPVDIRSLGVPAVFSADKSGESTAIRSLGRSAVGEAELELRSWIESNGSLKEGFGRDGKGTGMKRGSFVLKEAFEVLRGRCEEFSTLAGDEGPDSSTETERMRAWVAAGGIGEEVVLSPAALYITAILEHVCEHTLAALARVVGRDSDNTAASLEDLFTAVAEDDGIWGFFKRMQVRKALEQAIQTRQKRVHPSRPADRAVSRGAPGLGQSGSQTSLVQPSVSGGIRDQDPNKKSSLPPSSYDTRASHDTSRSMIGGVSSSMNKSPSMGSSARFGPGIGPTRELHNRTPSVLSNNTRNMIGAYNDQSDAGSQFGRSRRDEEDEFDALVASGETMKVSLTPSRLKNFDAGRKQSPGNNQANVRRDRPSTSSPPRQEELPPLLPRTATPSSAANGTPPRPPRSSSMRSRAGSNAAVAAAAAAAQPKLQARDASIVAEQEDSEDLADDSYAPQPRKASGRESLAELLASTGPASAPGTEYENGHGEVKRTVPAVIVGTAPPRFDDLSESRSDASVPRASVNRPDRIVPEASPDLENLGGRKKSQTREMADFFNDGPPEPNPRRSPPTANSATLGSTGNGNAGKPKTPAQEMADFFNNTPAPPTSSAAPMRFGAPVENLAPAPAKKGFKGFMSKIGGGGSKRKGSVDQSTEDFSRLGSGQEARKQKSMASMATTTGPSGQSMSASTSGEGTTNASSIADAYRTQQQQSPPADRQPPPLAAPITTDPSYPSQTQQPLQDQTRPPLPKKPSETSLGGSAVGAGAASLAVAAGAAGMSRKLSIRKPVPSVDAAASPGIPPSPSLTLPPASGFQPSPTPSSRGAPRKPSTVDEQSDIGSDILPDQPAPPVSQPIADDEAVQTSGEKKSNDQMSFATARERQSGSPSREDHETEDGSNTPRVVQGAIVGAGVIGGVDSVPEAREARAARAARAARDGVDVEEKENGDGEMDTVPEAAGVRDEIPTETVETSSTVVDPLSDVPQSHPPSIPLGDLLPLRHLLDGATSVKECQMLLAAILSQWGVPPLGSEGDGGKVDPESRIAAWLLAGRDGPVGDAALKAGEGHGQKASSEGTAVAGGLEPEAREVEAKDGNEEERVDEVVTVAGVVEDVRKLALGGVRDLGKMF